MSRKSSQKRIKQTSRSVRLDGATLLGLEPGPQSPAPEQVARDLGALGAAVGAPAAREPVTAQVRTPTQLPAAPLLTVSNSARAWRALVNAVADLLEGRQRLWVLEAGAGTRTLFDLPEDAYVVGVDRNPMALEYNARLDERIACDLSDYHPSVAGFDLITCWYILDRMADPAPVLDHLAEWAGDAGLIVLAVPNLRSPRGLVARMAGRTRLRQQLTPGALRRRFAEHGFSLAFQVSFEDSDQAAWRRRVRLTQGRWRFAQSVVRVLSAGLIDAARTDYIAVFRRDT